MCWKSAALVLLLFTVTPAFSQDVESQDAKDVSLSQDADLQGEKPQSGQALDDAIEANSEAQDYNEETEPVKAQIVKEEPAVLIASGTGDVDTTGKKKSCHSHFVSNLDFTFFHLEALESSWRLLAFEIC